MTPLLGTLSLTKYAQCALPLLHVRDGGERKRFSLV